LRAAVYNRFMQSMGGGERHSGMLAQVLAEDGHEVDLLGHEEVDKDAFADHLGLSLDKVNLRLIPDLGEHDLTLVSGEYDLFVNASYMSRLVPCARHNLYLCYFPTPPDHDLSPLRRRLVQLLGAYVRGRVPSITHGLGWFPPEGGRRRSYIWSSGHASLSLPPGPARQLVFELGRPGAPGPVTLVVTGGDGHELLRVQASPDRFRRVAVPLPAGAPGLLLQLDSETFVPGAGDPRSLGVAVSRLRVAGSGHRPRQWAAERFPWLLRDPRDLGWLERYDRVLTNSEFTREWIGRYWHLDADVLYPPIRVHELRPGAKQRRIITVGRFFPRGQGHSKKQLEQVRAFGAMVGHGRLDGWELHVVGGVEPKQRPYFEEVRRAAQGLPVRLHPSAPRALVEELLGSSSIFWAATGLGEDEHQAPWTFEHFGMTTVEAMAAGCVPVVIDKAGQREIVRHGVDGFRWTTLDQLEARTRELIADGALRERMAAVAVERAQEFSDKAFAERWRDIASKLQLGG
jgi:glycosyltransferase involved in cell wall biosynthesis